jgi:hypothetical protein
MAILNLEVLMSDDNGHVDYSSMFDAGADNSNMEPTPVEAPVEEAPVEEAPVEAPVEEAPVEAAVEAPVEEAPADFPKAAVVSIDPVFKLRLRTAPNKDASIVEMLGNDAKLSVLGMPNPDWFKVEVVYSGEVGFVNSAYVTLADE